MKIICAAPTYKVHHPQKQLQEEKRNTRGKPTLKEACLKGGPDLTSNSSIDTAACGQGSGWRVGESNSLRAFWVCFFLRGGHLCEQAASVQTLETRVRAEAGVFPRAAGIEQQVPESRVPAARWNAHPRRRKHIPVGRSASVKHACLSEAAYVYMGAGPALG